MDLLRYNATQVMLTAGIPKLTLIDACTAAEPFNSGALRSGWVPFILSFLLTVVTTFSARREHQIVTYLVSTAKAVIG